MSRVRGNQLLLPSVYDRLMDDEPGVLRETPKSRHQVLRELKRSVRRDLEDLLNTRQSLNEWPRTLSELDHSIVNYGVPDLVGTNLGSKEERQQLRDRVQDCIERFEPRFKTVRVLLLENADDFDRTLRFKIEGTLYAEPAPEPVVFDSLVEPHSAEITVRVGAE